MENTNEAPQEQPKKKRKYTPKGLTYKEKSFISHFTNEKSPETFLNATQSALKAYNVSSAKSAAKIGSTKLAKGEIKDAIERRIATKEEDQQILTRYVDRLDTILRTDGITPENSVFIREMRELVKLNGQFRGDFVEKSVNINVETSIEAVNDRFNTLFGGGGER